VECRAWAAEREEMEAIISPLDLDTLVEKMVSSIQTWEAVSTFIKRIMTQKEALERTQQLEERNDFIYLSFFFCRPKTKIQGG